MIITIASPFLQAPSLSGKSQHDDMEEQGMYGEVYDQQAAPSSQPTGGYTQEQVDGRYYLLCLCVR